MEDQVIDNEIIVDENDKDVRMAGFWIRFGATFIDGLVLIPVTGLSMYNIYFLKSFPLVLLVMVITLLYKPLMEFKYGATLGKMAVKIQVVNLDNNVISLSQAITRYIPWIIGIVISTFSSYILFQNPEFLATTDWMQVGRIQQEVQPKITYLGSLILFVSGIIIAFNDKKQGLHDMIAKTYCVYK